MVFLGVGVKDEKSAKTTLSFCWPEPNPFHFSFGALLILSET